MIGVLAKLKVTKLMKLKMINRRRFRKKMGNQKMDFLNKNKKLKETANKKKNMNKMITGVRTSKMKIKKLKQNKIHKSKRKK